MSMLAMSMIEKLMIFMIKQGRKDTQAKPSQSAGQAKRLKPAPGPGSWEAPDFKKANNALKRRKARELQPPGIRNGKDCHFQ